MDTTILDNKYVVGFLTLVIVLYASMIGPNLPSSFKSIFNNVIFKMAILFMVLIIGNTNPALALVIAIAFVLTMDFLYTHDSKDAFSNVINLNNMSIDDKNINIKQQSSSGITNIINTTPPMHNNIIDFMKMAKDHFLHNYNVMTPNPKTKQHDFANFFMLSIYAFNTNPSNDYNNLLTIVDDLYSKRNSDKEVTKSIEDGMHKFHSYEFSIYLKLVLLFYLDVNPYLLSTLEIQINRNPIVQNSYNLNSIIQNIIIQYNSHKTEYDNGNDQVKNSFNAIWFGFYIDCFYSDTFNNAWDSAVDNYINKYPENKSLVFNNNNIKNNVIKLLNQIIGSSTLDNSKGIIQPNREVINFPGTKDPKTGFITNTDTYNSGRFPDKVKLLEELIRKSLPNYNK